MIASLFVDMIAGVVVIVNVIVVDLVVVVVVLVVIVIIVHGDQSENENSDPCGRQIPRYSYPGRSFFVCELSYHIVDAVDATSTRYQLPVTRYDGKLPGSDDDASECLVSLP